MPGLCDACGAADDALRAAEAIAKRCASAGIPERFRWATGLDCPELRSRVARPAAIEAVRQLDTSVSAVLYGPAGCGKTSLAVALLRDRLAAGQSARFVAARTLRPVDTDRLDRDVIHRAVTARVLVLDDVGAEMAGAQSGGHLAALRSEGVRHVIETRHDRGLPTLITTGFDSKALGELYGSGVARRLYEDAKRAEQIIRCDAPATK
jgi:DNA replication protein DnaC